MPRIPMGEAAGLVRNREDAVEMRGAPGMDFGMDVGRALSDLGRGIGETGLRLGDMGMAFGRHLQETEDRLQATRIESLWRDRQSELEARMAENPGAYEQFGEWARETDSEFLDAAKPFREKMSSRALELLDARMAGIRKEALHRRERIGKQARVTADYKLFQMQWEEAATRGDQEACDAMLEAHRGTLISEQEYEQKKQDFERLAQGGEAKRRVLAGDWDIASDLRETDSEGRYVNYPAMDEAYRKKLLKFAETEEAKMMAAAQEELLQRMESGEAVTEEDIEKNFAGQEMTAGARKMKESQLSIVKAFHAKKDKEQARQAEAKRKKQLDAAEYGLISYQFPDDASARDKQYAELKSEILKTYAGDGPAVKRLLGQLDEVYKASAKPDKSYKSGFVYQQAKEYLKSFKPSAFKTYGSAGDWTRTKNAEQEKASYHEMAVAVDKFFQRNPNASFEEAKKYIDGVVAFIGQQAAADLVSAWLKAESGELDAGWRAR